MAAATNENKVANTAIDFLVGDILVDTKYDYGGHVMVVVKVDPLHDRIVITHPAFTFPARQKWNKYTAFENKDPREGKAKYILRWIGPSHAVHRDGKHMAIRDKLVEVVNYLHYLLSINQYLDYSRFKGACMYIKNKCFTSNRKISDKSLDEIQASESFVCSSYGTFIWKYVLEQFEIPEELRTHAPVDAHTLDDIGFPIDPYECLPRDVKQIADRFPQFWEKIPYYTKKTEFVELKELTDKRIPIAPSPAPITYSSRPNVNISSFPYLFGGKRKSIHRRRQTKRRKQRRGTRK